MANSVLVTAVTQSPSRRQLFDVSKMPPNGAEWLQEADAIYLTAIAIATLAVIAVLAMTFLHLYYIYHYISNQSIQDNMYYITLLLPVSFIPL
ncbi:unnamed protein product [Anisakis simplex]|uniref:Transmembrane protein n=1 Tax=Anisakis simplex TaxID=6269 RepID=A0A0M3KFH8_ANISI|nr:unnamed protein product [Anisakis simplex]